MLRVVFLGVTLAACSVGSVLPEGGGGAQPDAATGGGGGGGGGSGSGSGGNSTAALTITATTQQTAAPAYAPSHVLAVWVENSGGTIVKTINRYSDIRTVALVAWGQKAGTNDVDAVSGATRTSHATPVQITWDMKDRQGAVVADGTYTLRMELSDTNATAANQNNQGTFTFVKGTQPQMQTGLSNGRFTNVSINFTP
jgi:hypothetical protein